MVKEKALASKTFGLIKQANTLFKKFGLTLVLLLILLALSWRPITGDYPPTKIDQLMVKINQQTQINQQKQTENDWLLQELTAMTNLESQALESQARYRLGLIKQGEIYYQYQ